MGQALTSLLSGKFAEIQETLKSHKSMTLSQRVDMWQIDEWTNYPTSSTADRRHSKPSKIKTYLSLSASCPRHQSQRVYRKLDADVDQYSSSIYCQTQQWSGQSRPTWSKMEYAEEKRPISIGVNTKFSKAVRSDFFINQSIFLLSRELGGW